MGHLIDRPIELAALVGEVAAPDRGGIATFLGIVRDHHAGRAVERLEYTAYAPMAEAEIAAIAAEAEARWPAKVAVRHRVGALAIGDVAVAIAVGSGHRDAAFDACRHVIEELKRRVPIWKKEFYADGSVAWVDPTAPGGTVPAERLNG
ncbi:MAG TPA: molybdenum cofactor biosynthesis protein MoaE [Gemmatimonadales bacterium]|nr:molybdenum cofactor biosynthesis protein MoaE [Gemmatimonadales bacterium]